MGQRSPTFANIRIKTACTVFSTNMEVKGTIFKPQHQPGKHGFKPPEGPSPGIYPAGSTWASLAIVAKNGDKGHLYISTTSAVTGCLASLLGQAAESKLFAALSMSRRKGVFSANYWSRHLGRRFATGMTFGEGHECGLLFRFVPCRLSCYSPAVPSRLAVIPTNEQTLQQHAFAESKRRSAHTL